MTAEQMWAEFAAGHGLKDVSYESWAFGDDADTLARLTLEGVKSATSSALPAYEREGEPLPEAGAYSVVLDSRGEAVCVIRTDRVYTAHFRDIGPDHAFREGEGDRSLEYWRRVHEAFFTRELAQMGERFVPDMMVVCEEFSRVWPEDPVRRG